MYNLPYYKEKDAAVVLAFMQQYPFATLMGVDAEHKPVATQVPLLITEKDGRIFLRGHIMKNNDHHLAFVQNNNVLVLFTGPNTYVSASWYENKQQGSTWNYMSVHAKGTMEFLPEEELLQVLDDLTSHFENDPVSPSLYKHLSQEYISRMSKAIVAFEIKVGSMDNVFKLSQNRDKKSFENILEQLDNGSDNAKAIASEMRKRKNSFFPA